MPIIQKIIQTNVSEEHEHDDNGISPNEANTFTALQTHSAGIHIDSGNLNIDTTNLSSITIDTTPLDSSHLNDSNNLPKKNTENTFTENQQYNKSHIFKNATSLTNDESISMKSTRDVVGGEKLTFTGNYANNIQK